MKRFNTLDKRISVIKKIVEEEHELVLDKTPKEIADLINNEQGFLIDSSVLELGDKINIIFYEQNGEYNEEKMIDDIIDSINLLEYEKYEIIVFVHTIEEKIKVNENVKEKIAAFFKSKRKSKKVWEFSVQFIGSDENKHVSIGVDSSIRILEYTHIDPSAEGKVYNANLYDLVNLYNLTGDLLFKDNVREKIEDVLNVDTEIQKTLDSEPENFWFFNNGVTIMLDSECLSQRREYQLDIDISNTAELSVINGAQTISVATFYYYKLINDIESSDDEDSDLKDELKSKLESAKQAKVLLRIIKKDESKGEEKFYKEISVSLNRQKAINDSDIRYTEYLIEDINNISEGKGNPYFYIDKREDKKQKKMPRHYSVERFVKVSAIYLLQEPGSARSAKGKYIKQDTQWNRLNVSEKGNLSEELFLRKYKAFVIMEKVFEQISKVLSATSKICDELELTGIYKYGSEFLTAYIAWVANGKNCDDFTNFPEKLKLDNNLVAEIVREFARAAYECFENDEIESNLFKKDKKYIELRECLDTNDHMQEMIKGLFEK